MKGKKLNLEDIVKSAEYINSHYPIEPIKILIKHKESKLMENLLEEIEEIKKKMKEQRDICNYHALSDDEIDACQTEEELKNLFFKHDEFFDLILIELAKRQINE